MTKEYLLYIIIIGAAFLVHIVNTILLYINLIKMNKKLKKELERRKSIAKLLIKKDCIHHTEHGCSFDLKKTISNNKLICDNCGEYFSRNKINDRKIK
jgi:hypothetical protein